MKQQLPHEILQEKIQTKFDELRDKIIRYEDSNTEQDWCACIDVLPQIADLVCCLKQEAMKYEGRHPLN